MWNYLWFGLIGLCVLATIVVAALDSTRKKKAYAANQAQYDETAQDDVQAMDNLDGLDQLPTEPDFDFPK